MENNSSDKNLADAMSAQTPAPATTPEAINTPVVEIKPGENAAAAVAKQVVQQAAAAAPQKEIKVVHQGESLWRAAIRGLITGGCTAAAVCGITLLFGAFTGSSGNSTSEWF